MRAACTFLACLALTAGVTGTASAKTVWLCKPGLAENPCARSLTSTVVGADGSQTTERTRRPRRPRIDCFYVYPTVSGQDRTNATRTAEPEQRSVAEQQAARFSQECRVFAPVYRQLTLSAIGAEIPAAAALRAFGDVRAAWRDYLRNHNNGRGVVLVGHSQGAYLLRQLIRDEIDRRAHVRRRLVSALLLGGNVLVKKGRDSGGDFRNIRACRAARQTGCVVAYSAFYGTPPAEARVSRATDRFGITADPATQEVLCTNPAALGGGSGGLDPTSPPLRSPGLWARSTTPLPHRYPRAGSPFRGSTGPGAGEGTARSGWA